MSNQSHHSRIHTVTHIYSVTHTLTHTHTHDVPGRSDYSNMFVLLKHRCGFPHRVQQKTTYHTLEAQNPASSQELEYKIRRSAELCFFGVSTHNRNNNNNQESAADMNKITYKRRCYLYAARETKEYDPHIHTRVHAVDTLVLKHTLTHVCTPVHTHARIDVYKHTMT